jgi:transcription elongation factor Elf1
MSDHPLKDCVATAAPLIKSGAKVHQKFTCEHCGERQTMETPNRFYTKGTCEECGKMTDIEARGCNYVVIYGV